MVRRLRIALDILAQIADISRQTFRAGDRRMNTSRRISIIAVVALACAVPACRVTDWRLWNRGAEPVGFEVETVRDITYCDGAKADTHRHRLDLYLPKGKKD